MQNIGNDICLQYKCLWFRIQITYLLSITNFVLILFAMASTLQEDTTTTGNAPPQVNIQRGMI